MTLADGGGVLRRTFVSELGSAVGLYQCRASCTRCVPRWLGPVHTNLAAATLSGFALDPEVAVARARDRARIDVLAHVDRRHNGRL